MTFKQAYKIATERSERFRQHDRKVKAAMESGNATPCMIFTVDASAVFYYGFDGVDLRAGKHTQRRANTLFDKEEVLIIL